MSGSWQANDTLKGRKKPEIFASGRVEVTNDSTPKLFGQCPTAEILIAGCPVQCILDTGAETSLVTYEFYQTRLRNLVKHPDHGHFIKVVGANNLAIPILGIIDVPLTINSQTVVISMLVKDHQSDDEIQGQRSRYPILLGCNALRQIMKIMKLDDLSHSWQTTFAVLQFDGHKESGQPGDMPAPHRSSHVVTGRNWEAVPADSVRVMHCNLVGKIDSSKDCILLEQPGISSERSFLGLEVVEGCQQVSVGENQVTILMQNNSPKPVLVPPFTSVANASFIDPVTEAFAVANGNVIEVDVHEVVVVTEQPLGTPKSDKAVSAISSPSLEDCGMLPACPVEQSNSHSLLPISDLPPGIDLSGVNPSILPSLVDLIWKRREAFSSGPLDLGRCDVIPHQIRLVDNNPVNLPFRRIPPYLVKEVRDHIQCMLDKGIIQKSSSSYASAIVPVRKRDGSLRLCVDYRQLNRKTIKDAFPLPRIEECLDALSGAVCFSSLDLAHGYFQITMEESSIPLTAFRVPWGLYEFTRLPQGLVNSPGTFMRIMDCYI